MTSQLCQSSMQLASQSSSTVGTLPVIFSPSYDPQLANFNFGNYGLSSDKRRKIQTHLKEELSLSDETFIAPQAVAPTTLGRVHHVDYIARLNNNSAEISAAFGVPDLREIQLPALQEGLLRPMQLATGGTLQAVDLAAQHGWSINLSGGFHHAHFAKGGGYCFYNDIALAAIFAREKLAPNEKVLIIDLDAHLGDGTAMIMKRNNRVVILDVFNGDIWPAKENKYMARLDFYQAISNGTGDKVYLEVVKKLLDSALNKHEIGFIIYNAGADIHQADLKGRLSVSGLAVKERDKFVFESARSRNIPIVTLLAGAYGPEAPALIGDSLGELIKTTDEFWNRNQHA